MEKEKLDYMVLFRIGQKLYEMIYAGLMWQSGFQSEFLKAVKFFFQL